MIGDGFEHGAASYPLLTLNYVILEFRTTRVLQVLPGEVRADCQIFEKREARSQQSRHPVPVYHGIALASPTRVDICVLERAPSLGSTARGSRPLAA